MAKQSFFSVLLGRPAPVSEETAQKVRAIEASGAEANAILNKINREPSHIDHMAKTYPKAFPNELNGSTKGIWVREEFSDKYCQVLQVKFQPMGYSPAHTHPHYCVCHVLEGEIIDTVRGGKRFDQGDWYVTKPGEVHSAQSINGATIEVYNTMSEAVAMQIFTIRKYERHPYTQPIDRIKFQVA